MCVLVSTTDDQLLYRAVPGHLIQFGIAADAAATAKWERRRFSDSGGETKRLEKAHKALKEARAVAAAGDDDDVSGNGSAMAVATTAARRRRFLRGYLSFAGRGRDSRSCHVFAALAPPGKMYHPTLGAKPWEEPFGFIFLNMTGFEQAALAPGYGNAPMRKQTALRRRGNKVCMFACSHVVISRSIHTHTHGVLVVTSLSHVRHTHTDLHTHTHRKHLSFSLSIRLQAMLRRYSRLARIIHCFEAERAGEHRPPPPSFSEPGKDLEKKTSQINAATVLAIEWINKQFVHMDGTSSKACSDNGGKGDPLGKNAMRLLRSFLSLCVASRTQFSQCFSQRMSNLSFSGDCR
jgi:hypothetical protein